MDELGLIFCGFCFVQTVILKNLSRFSTNSISGPLFSVASKQICYFYHRAIFHTVYPFQNNGYAT